VSTNDSLAGFRVIDLTEGICGPFTSMQLADAGAEVIKVEPPNGDYARQIGPPFINGESAVFLSVNRNKKSVVLDYRRDDQHGILSRLAATADILIEDLGPGEADRLGFGYSQLSSQNPRLIYCAISPFGEEGPLKDLPGSELVIQAMAEYTASLGRIGDPPIRVGADVACINTGIFATQAILAALFHSPYRRLEARWGKVWAATAGTAAVTIVIVVPVVLVTAVFIQEAALAITSVDLSVQTEAFARLQRIWMRVQASRLGANLGNLQDLVQQGTAWLAGFVAGQAGDHRSRRARRSGSGPGAALAQPVGQRVLQAQARQADDRRLCRPHHPCRPLYGGAALLGVRLPLQVRAAGSPSHV